MKCASVAVVLFGFSTFAVPVSGEVCPAGTPVVTFDHGAQADVLSGAVRRADGEQFVIRVVNTKPTEFTYTVAGAVAVAQDPANMMMSADDVHDECVTHDKKFGGYIMKVEPKAGTTPGLSTKLIMVHVATEDWQVEFGGAFPVAWFKSPQYALAPLGDGNLRVIRDDGTDEDPKTDPFRLGGAAFVTTYHEKRPHVGLTFGLGVDDETSATYFFGGTLRLGKQAGLTAGLALGSVSRLPSGVNVGDTTTNPNLLADDPQRTTTAFFVALSYSFLGSANTLKAPFAGQ